MALDKLNDMASNEEYLDVKFLSICCDNLDGAREIIERDDELKWPHVSHYFMDFESKEEAKRILGFTSVPFYVFVNENNIVVQKGGPANIDFDVFRNKSHESNLQKNQQNVDNQMHIENSADRVFEIDEDF